MPQALRDLKVGQKIGRFKVRGKLGQGSAGWVVRAEDITLKRPVALKLLPFDTQRDSSHREAAEVFLAEARRAAQLVHPGIVQILEIGRTKQLVFIAMELLEGGTLQQKLREEGTLPWRRAVEWIIEASAGLGYAHEQGVIHRDVKPANLMLTATGHVKIMDFGLAYAEMAAEAEAADKEIGSPESGVAGTPYFMAPEVLRGQSSPRSDVFSLGASLWYLLTGAPPFEIRKLTDVGKIGNGLELGDLSEARPDLPAPIARVLGEALDPDPEGRPADANALGEALRKAVNEVDIPVARPASHAPSSAPAQGNRRMIILAGAIALGLGAGVAVTAAFIFGPGSNGPVMPETAENQSNGDAPANGAAASGDASAGEAIDDDATAEGDGAGTGGASDEAGSRAAESQAGEGQNGQTAGAGEPGGPGEAGEGADGIARDPGDAAQGEAAEETGGAGPEPADGVDAAEAGQTAQPQPPVAEAAGADGNAEAAPQSPDDGTAQDGDQQAVAGGDAAPAEPEASRRPALPTPPPDHPVMTLSVAKQMERINEYARANTPHRFAVYGRIDGVPGGGEAAQPMLWLATEERPRAVGVRLPQTSTDALINQLALPKADDAAGRWIMVDGVLSWSSEWNAPVVDAASLEGLQRIDPAGEGVVDAHAGGALVFAALKGRKKVEVQGRIQSTRQLSDGRVVVWELETGENGPAVRVRLTRRQFGQVRNAVGTPHGPAAEGRSVLVTGKPEYLLKPDAVVIEARRIQPPDPRRAALVSNAVVVQTTDYGQIQSLLKQNGHNRYAFQGRVNKEPAIVPTRGMILMLGSPRRPVAVQAPRSTINALQNRFGPRAQKLTGQTIQVIGSIDQPGRSAPTIKIDSASQIRIIESDGR